MRDFFDFILPKDGLVEVRSIRRGEVRQHFTPDREEAADLARTMDAKEWDVYYGVLPRMEPKGTAEAVSRTADVLWADLDAKGETTKANALQSLIDYDIPPAVIVDSGHGYHAYWKLAKSIPTSRATLIMRGLAKHLNGDAVYDAPRILRVPGTTNWKDTPVKVRTLRFDMLRLMRAGDFDWAESTAHDIEAKRSKPRKALAYIAPTSRPALEPWLQRLIDDGAPLGYRSEACFKVMVHLAMRGYSDSEIYAIFDSHNIGEKYREMSDYEGKRWMDRSLDRARR